MLKVCRRCDQEKPVTDYYGPTRSYCKECERKDARKRMARPGNRIRTAFRRAKRTARQFDAPDDLSYDDVAYTFAIAGGHCAYCGQPSQRLQLEHIVPLSRGGWNSLCNVTTACPSCNRRKRTTALLTLTEQNEMDTQLILRLIKGMAYRLGTDTFEIIEILRQQQGDYTAEELARYTERATS
ncbi:hypothetical protein FRY77_31065 [Halomonas sp. MG34]|nr:hypothetical protein [Halomonas sp. MG34]